MKNPITSTNSQNVTSFIAFCPQINIYFARNKFNGKTGTSTPWVNKLIEFGLNISNNPIYLDGLIKSAQAGIFLITNNSPPSL